MFFVFFPSPQVREKTKKEETPFLRERRGEDVPQSECQEQPGARLHGWGSVAREQSAAGAERVRAVEASMLAGSVEAAKEPEHLEGSLAHLTLPSCWSTQMASDKKSGALRRLANVCSWPTRRVPLGKGGG